jgi:hypothetical protein
MSNIRRDQFEDQLKALQEDIFKLSKKLVHTRKENSTILDSVLAITFPD